MLLMDRENALARGWSHVVSDSDDLAELEEFRVRMGAPPRALQFGDGHRPHLDLKLEPRERALADPGVRVFERTRDLILHLRALGTGAGR
jgi:hypothetical protein